jgi:hypothetical protein
MKVRLLSGKFYRREKEGRLVRYSAGDLIEVSDMEASRLDVREEIISPSPSKTKIAVKRKTTTKADVKKTDAKKQDKVEVKPFETSNEKEVEVNA